MDGVRQIGPEEKSMFPGILYAEDFDSMDEVCKPDLEPAQPTFTLAELEAAQAAASCEAVLLARASWETGSSNLRSQLLDRVAASITAAQDGARLLAEEVATEMSKAVLTVLAGLLPHFCRSHGDAEMRAMLRQLLPQLAQQPRIVIRIHPAALDGVRQDLRELDSEIMANVTVMTLDTLGRDDVRVGWANGALRRDGNATAAALSAGLVELGLVEPASCPTATSLSDQRKWSMADAE